MPYFFGYQVKKRNSLSYGEGDEIYKKAKKAIEIKLPVGINSLISVNSQS